MAGSGHFRYAVPGMLSLEKIVPIQSSQVPLGTLAPLFDLPSADGGHVALADYRGRTSVVLVFLRNAR